MIAPCAVALFAVIRMNADTTFVLGRVERDITGDSVPELLQLVAVGRTVDSLEVTFTIESSGTEVFRLRLAPLTRTLGYDRGRRRLDSAEHDARLKGFGGWFFEASKFESPAAYVDRLRSSARRHVSEIPEVIARSRAPHDSRTGAGIWQEIQASPVTVFSFSPGGDRVMAIAWSAESRRFHHLIECC